MTDFRALCAALVDEAPYESPATCLARAAQAAQWGADREREACCEWLKEQGTHNLAEQLEYARRPKPPSLKEQALAELDAAVLRGDCISTSAATPLLRRALEQLDD